MHAFIDTSMVSCMTEYVWVHVCDSEMYSGKSDIFVPSDLLYNVWKVCVCVHAYITISSIVIAVLSHIHAHVDVLLILSPMLAWLYVSHLTVCMYVCMDVCMQRSSHMAGYEQHDAHEFFIALLDGLHTDCMAGWPHPRMAGPIRCMA